MSKRPRVLIADDYPDMVKAVSRLLAPDCDIVGTVTDGRTLLETARRLQPDVLVLDLTLQNLHSLDACRQIRREIPATKVIILTAMDDAKIRQACLDAGASDFVSKLATVDLLAVTKRVCGDGG